MSSIGVPIKILHEAQGMIISVELKTGHLYRGKLSTLEDTLNLHLTSATCTSPSGQLTPMDCVMLRGSHIRFIQIPDNLRHAPVFKTFASRGEKVRGLGLGKARAEVARSSASKHDFVEILY